eukprot:jgi/Mesvir1/14808/Mv05445-RA.3
MGLTFTCGAFRRPGDGGARHGWVKVEPNEDSRLLPVCGGLLFQLAISDATGQLVGWGDGVPDGRARADGGKVGGGILGGAPDSSSACIASHVPQSVLPPGLGRVVCAASGWDRACAVTEESQAAGGVSLAAAATASPSSQREALRDKKGATITQKPSGSGEPPAKAPRTLGGSLVRFTSLALGEEHALALDENGQVWAWGSGAQGQLGMGRDTLAVTEPQRVPGKRMGHGGNAGTQAAILSGIRTGVHNADIPGPASPPEFCAGEGGSCVGNPTVAQGGRGVHRLRRAVKVACGGRHSLILSERGELFSFGWGLYGQTGHGCTDDSFEPRLVGALAGCPVADVAASVWHTVAATVDGAVYAWGWNKFGQLGLPESSSELTPALVESPLLDDVCIVAVSCGARHTAVVSGACPQQCVERSFLLLLSGPVGCVGQTELLAFSFPSQNPWLASIGYVRALTGLITHCHRCCYIFFATTLYVECFFYFYIVFKLCSRLLFIFTQGRFYGICKTSRCEGCFLFALSD